MIKTHLPVDFIIVFAECNCIDYIVYLLRMRNVCISLIENIHRSFMEIVDNYGAF
jgi:hypothetical protein